MQVSLSTVDLARYVARQLSTFFPDRELSGADVLPLVQRSLDRVEHCFLRVRTKYYFEQAGAVFNHLNTDHYVAFLYFMSREGFSVGDTQLAAKLYGLNKALHAVDIFYEIDLPSVFLLRHPVGTVLGRAIYSDYLCVYQNCVVGQGFSGGVPRFNGPCVLFGGSHVVGRSELGANAWVALGAQVIDAVIPADHIAQGRPPNFSVRPTKRSVQRELFES